MKPRLSAIVSYAALMLAAAPVYSQQPAENKLSPLAEVIQKSTSGELKELIASGLNVNSVDPQGNTMLLLSAAAQRSDLMYVLLEAGADPNYVQDPGVTALGIACIFDDWSMVDLLITYGADVNYCAPNGESTLSMACAQGAINAAQMLLAAGAKTDVRDSKGVTPLLHAIMNVSDNGIQIARMLLEKNADANFAMPNGFTPLMGAVQLNNEEKVKMLLEKGANVNARQVTSETAAISIAVALGHQDMLALLLEHKADISAGINKRTSLLSYSSTLARADMMEMLLKHGASANTRDMASLASPLHITATGNNLIKNSLKLMGASNLIPQHEAKMDAPNACRVLIENGAQVDAEDIEGVTPLMIAAMDGCPETTAVLLAHKANVNHVDNHGRTPLIHAVLPVSTKADISLGNVSAATAQRLKPEVEKGLTQYADVVNTVKLLLEAGADINMKDKSGKTARDYACDEEVIKLLDAAVAK